MYDVREKYLLNILNASLMPKVLPHLNSLFYWARKISEYCLIECNIPPIHTSIGFPLAVLSTLNLKTPKAGGVQLVIVLTFGTNPTSSKFHFFFLLTEGSQPFGLD